MDHRYFYEGPVLEFDKVIAKCWRGETIASSKRKARSNLAYQFKRATNRTCLLYTSQGIAISS